MNTCLSGGHRVLIRQVELRELRMQLVHPFETSFGKTQERRIVIVKVSDGSRDGYGEVTAGEGPFYSHETYQTAWHILSDFIIPRTIGRELETAKDFQSFVRGIRGHRMAQAGMETALWDLEARNKSVPLWKLLGGTRMEIDCGVSIGDYIDAPAAFALDGIGILPVAVTEVRMIPENFGVLDTLKRMRHGRGSLRRSLRAVTVSALLRRIPKPRRGLQQKQQRENHFGFTPG